MEKSQSIKEISNAIMKFRLLSTTIKKDSTNPFFKSKYASLSNILNEIDPHLIEAGLTFTQFPDGDSLTTLLLHPESGEYLQSSYQINSVKNDPQGWGSAITYARRYALTAILGLNVEDDDGEKALGRARESVSSKNTNGNKPVLNQYSKGWEKAKAAIKNNSTTIEAIRKHYQLTDADAKLLKDA